MDRPINCWPSMPCAPTETLQAADYSGLGFAQEALRQAAPTDLRPILLAIAFLLFIADSLASLWLSGGLSRRVSRAAAAAMIVFGRGRRALCRRT